MSEEVLTEPPAEEGNDQEAAEGTDEVGVTEGDLKDAPALIEEDEDDDDADETNA